MPLKLQVWFGILFRPAEHATPEQPALPGWAQQLLSACLDGEIMNAELAGRGYTGQQLSWIRQADTQDPGYASYFGVAVAASVHPGDRSEAADAGYPDDVVDGWAHSLAQACYILQLPSGADMTWYQSAAWQL